MTIKYVFMLSIVFIARSCSATDPVNDSVVEGISNLEERRYRDPETVEVINVTGRQLTAVPQLSPFMGLKHLLLGRTTLIDLGSLPVISTLELLQVSGNALTQLNLSGFRSLHTVWAHNNQITKLNLSLSGLKLLGLSRNKLKALDGLDDCLQLETVNVQHNPELTISAVQTFLGDRPRVTVKHDAV